MLSLVAKINLMVSYVDAAYDDAMAADAMVGRLDLSSKPPSDDGLPLRCHLGQLPRLRRFWWAFRT